MSCAVGIYDKVGMTSPLDGTWKYIGYSTLSSGPFTSTPVNGLFPSVGLNTLLTGWGYNFNVDENDKTAGYYKLEYRHSAGVDNVILQILDSNPCAGTVISRDVASGSVTPINFNTIATSAGCSVSNGVWVAQTSGTGFNVNTGVLTPTALAPGLYKYQYILGSYPLGGCLDCKVQIEFDITIQSAVLFSASANIAPGTCGYTYHVYHPNGINENQILFTNAVDSTKYQLQYRAIVKDCGGVVVDNQLFTLNSTGQVSTEIFSGPMLTGGVFEVLRLRSTLGLDINIPVSPTTATFTGVGGTTNATDLTYNSSSPSIFYSAIEIAIRNYLGVLGYVSGVDYQLDRIGQYAGNQVSVRFGCKHNPTARWLGLAITFSRLTYRVSSGASIQTQVGALTYFGSIIFNNSFSGLPCVAGLNALSLNVVSLSYHAGAFDYNTLPLVSGGVVTVAPTGVLSKSCDSRTLTVTPIGCGGTVTYLWSTGATTSAISVPYIPFTLYLVTATCSSPSASVNLDVLI